MDAGSSCLSSLITIAIPLCGCWCLSVKFVLRGWHTAFMDRAPQTDLNLLDRDALVALVHAHREAIASLAAARDEHIQRLEAEVDAHRQTLSQQLNELSSRSERIEHMGNGGQPELRE